MTLETVGKLLRKAIKAYAGSSRSIDELSYKDVFRHAARHGLLDNTAVERWFSYRDNRNSTAHDYGKGFAEETLVLVPSFLTDSWQIEKILREKLGNADTLTCQRNTSACFEPSLTGTGRKKWRSGHTAVA